MFEGKVESFTLYHSSQICFSSSSYSVCLSVLHLFVLRGEREASAGHSRTAKSPAFLYRVTAFASSLPSSAQEFRSVSRVDTHRILRANSTTRQSHWFLLTLEAKPILPRNPISHPSFFLSTVAQFATISHKTTFTTITSNFPEEHATLFALSTNLLHISSESHRQHGRQDQQRRTSLLLRCARPIGPQARVQPAIPPAGSTIRRLSSTRCKLLSTTTEHGLLRSTAARRALPAGSISTRSLPAGSLRSPGRILPAR